MISNFKFQTSSALICTGLLLYMIYMYRAIVFNLIPFRFNMQLFIQKQPVFIHMYIHQVNNSFCYDHIIELNIIIPYIFHSLSMFLHSNSYKDHNTLN